MLQMGLHNVYGHVQRLGRALPVTCVIFSSLLLLLCRKALKSRALNLPSWSVSICSNRRRSRFAELTLHAVLSCAMPKLLCHSAMSCRRLSFNVVNTIIRKFPAKLAAGYTAGWQLYQTAVCHLCATCSAFAQWCHKCTIHCTAVYPLA